MQIPLLRIEVVKTICLIDQPFYVRMQHRRVPKYSDHVRNRLSHLNYGQIVPLMIEYAVSTYLLSTSLT